MADGVKVVKQVVPGNDSLCACDKDGDADSSSPSFLQTCFNLCSIRRSACDEFRSLVHAGNRVLRRRAMVSVRIIHESFNRGA